MIRNLFFTTLFICIFSFTNAQSLSREVIAAGGDFFETPAVSLSWTLGETVVETFQNNPIGLILTQGFQQPDDHTTVGILSVPKPEIFVNLYPNPAVHQVRLDVKYDENSKIKIELVDVLGKILNDDELNVVKGQLNNYQLDVSSLASGMYLFRLTADGALLNSYKFHKAN